MKAVKADMDQVHETGEELAELVGDVERVEVEKNLEDMDNMWDALNNRWAQRQKALDDALKRTTEFHDELMVSSLNLHITVNTVQFVPSLALYFIDYFTISFFLYSAC